VVLLSGGLDSAVLAAQEARTYRVHPVYVASGLAWEEGERRLVEDLLRHPALAGAPYALAPLTCLEFTMRDVYPASHWAIKGTPPAYDTPDEDVYLPGRNIALFSKVGVYAAAKQISRVVVAHLSSNPFPDATPEFFAAMSAALSLGLEASIEISAPFARLHKQDVVALGETLGVPYGLTLSCMNPAGLARTTHCGLCSKCRERRDAFREAGVRDPTLYANVSPR
jgi:7-cyano-7-deazaguanine synthase